MLRVSKEALGRVGLHGVVMNLKVPTASTKVLYKTFRRVPEFIRLYIKMRSKIMVTGPAL